MDHVILAALAKQQRYKSLVHSVPRDTLAPDTGAMLQWYALYFDTYPNRDHIQWDELESLVRLRSGGASAESLALTLHLVEQLKKPVSEEALAGTIKLLSELDFSGRAGALIAKYNSGGEIDLVFELKSLADQASRAMGAATPDTYVDTPIEELLGEVQNDSGIKFRRITTLNHNLAGLQGGADVIVAARPDKGKTSFLADTITDFAPQCVAQFGADRPILWLCNEGAGKRIVPRIYQAALGADLNEIISLSNAGELRARYAAALGTDKPNYIRVKDAHGMTMAQAEQVIEAMRPCVVVWDMLANMKIGKGVQAGSKADEIEILSQTARELAVRHDFISLKTMQISAEGDNQLFPPYSALKDSKTAAQGACDVILMLGSLNNPDAASIRGISTPKNKFQLPGKQSYVSTQLYFDGARCRFTEGTVA